MGESGRLVAQSGRGLPCTVELVSLKQQQMVRMIILVLCHGHDDDDGDDDDDDDDDDIEWQALMTFDDHALCMMIYQ